MAPIQTIDHGDYKIPLGSAIEIKTLANGRIVIKIAETKKTDTIKPTK